MASEREGGLEALQRTQPSKAAKESGALTSAERDALEYLYGGDRDVVIECWSARWVITRCKQKCVSVLHKGPMTQPVGARMVLERAKVDGEFGSCYTCESCLRAAKEGEQP